MGVKVITDSTSVVPEPLGRDLAVTSVPVLLHFADGSLRDGADLDGDELYRRLERGERVTTSSPSPGDFLAALQGAAADGYDAVFVTTVSSRLSAIHDAARVAAASFFDLPVTIFDSGSAVTGSGMVALEAARAAADGADLEEVAAAAVAVAGRVQVVGVVDTLRFLRRSGRVGVVKYWAGSAAGVKPMFRLNGGRVSRAGLPRTVSAGMDRLVRLVGHGEGDLHVGVFHAAAPERAEELVQRVIAAIPGVVEIFVSSFSSAMGAHTGPGVVGVGWWRS